jgi:hypothetical protein
MSHHPEGQRCTITVVMDDTPANRTALRAIPIQGGWQSSAVKSANGKFAHGIWCTTLPDASLVLLKALVGAVVTEGTDAAWMTKSGWTRDASTDPK